MSTLGSPAANWREEVNRKLAEHKNRKGGASATDVPSQPVTPGNSRAAQAAARVAARYAKAKSYSQMQAEEARLAVRAAEIATQVAREAQTEAESRLAEMHAASVERERPAELIPFENAARHPEPRQAEPQSAAAAEVPAPQWDWVADGVAVESAPAVAQPVVAPVPAAVAPPVAEPVIEPARAAAQPAAELPAGPVPIGPVTDTKTSSGQVLQIRWEPDMPALSGKAEPVPNPVPNPVSDPFEMAVEDWWTPAQPAENHAENQEGPIHVEAQAIQANLIQFPRELVATRRVRPRILEGIATHQEPGTQLSIFEVDPGSIETGAPAPEPINTSANAPVNAAWSTAEPLPAHSVEWAGPESATAASPAEAPTAQANPRTDWSASGWNGTPGWNGMKLGAQVRPEAPAPSLRDKLSLAPLNRRLMAGLVDAAAVGAAATFVWLTLALGMSHNLAPRAAELLGAGAIAAVALAYHAFFCFLAIPSLGMRYAGLSLCTFDEMIPTQEQLRKRFGAMVVSMLPLGLGMAWSVFDEDRLAWHDRYSQTYLRQN